MAAELTATEAAARLGLKKATLYAYVSRGLLHRRLAMDGRTSLFDPAEIDAFRTGRRRRADGEVDAVISTGLTHVSDDGLLVRGRDVVELIESGTAFEAVVDWLWGAGAEAWGHDGELIAVIESVRDAMPAESPLLDRIRVATALASATDPLRFDQTPAGVRAAGRRLLGALVFALPAGDSWPIDTPSPIAHRLWPRLGGGPAPSGGVVALDAALGLLADHGLASSTFAARIAASVRADPYSIVQAGLGVLGGTLHGAASRSVHDLFAEAERLGDPAVAVGDVNRRDGHPPGVGHAVYQREDPRYVVLMRMVNDAWAGDPRLAVVHAVRDLVATRTDALANIDLALGALTWLADMRPDAGEAVFAIARTSGWIAHGLEEFGEPPLRFRPRARYIGPR